MGKFLIVALCGLLLVGCKKETKPEATAPAKKDTAGCTKTATKAFKMYELTEMASLMERMYAENSQLKQRIVNGDTLGKFPEYMLTIHSAKMTDESDNDAFFKENAANFIKAQRAVYETPATAKQHFNDMVTACITCHESKCGGPIQRIKKLYIK
jgi:cytochrome c553